jgi:hypothetical protein
VGKSLKGVIARLKCERWWRRTLRKIHGREVEATAISLNMVSKKSQIYVSDASLGRRRSQKARTKTLLEGVEAVNELGERFTLQELSDLSVSNPKNRRAELMVRMAGLERIAMDLDHVGEFYTLTCPSRMHSARHTSGDRNPSYDGTTPEQAQKYLVHVWAKIRTALSNRNIKIYGLRVVEPHHDGTPHWHMLVFMEPEVRESVREIMRHYALEVDGSEPGAEKYRFKAVAIDRAKGTATGYIAKYISKNIDGYGVDEDNYGRDAKSSSERIEAFASTWGIRQFQQVGGPPVTVWRELRRTKPDAVKDSEILRQAVVAADAGDWAEFVRLMGGPSALRKDHPVHIVRLWSDKPGMYGEPLGNTIIGVVCGEEELITRIHQWKVDFKQGDAGISISGAGTVTGWAGTGAGTVMGWVGTGAGTVTGGAGTGPEPIRGGLSLGPELIRGGLELGPELIRGGLELGPERRWTQQALGLKLVSQKILLELGFCSPWSSVNNCTEVANWQSDAG